MAGITIDRDFARFGNKSYAINKINSIEVREVKPYNTNGAFWMAAIAAVAMGIGLTPLGGSVQNRVGMLVIAAAAGGICWKLLQRAKTVNYLLFLMTSSSEVQAFQSSDPDEVYSLRDRIEAAMAGRV